MIHGQTGVTAMSVQCYTFTDVYNAARDERQFDHCFWLQISCMLIGEHIFKLLGRLLVVVASFLILTIGASGFLIVLPVVATPRTLWFNFNIFWGLFLLFSICFNYISAVITDPGRPAYENQIEPHVSTVTDNTYKGKSCKKCSLPKPARTHHCSICKRCVLKMDHHCPWVNNCIGLNNYRYFYSFLLWTCLGTAYLAFLLGPTVLKEGSLLRLGEEQYETDRRKALHESDANLRGSIKLRRSLRQYPMKDGNEAFESPQFIDIDGAILSDRRVLSVKPGSGMFFTMQMCYEMAADEIQSHRDSDVSLSLLFILSGAISFAVGLLLGLHTYLLISAQTTIEFFLSIPERSKMKKAGRKYLNPYDRGWRSNIKQVFGHSMPLVLSVCLPSCRQPPLALGNKGLNSASQSEGQGQGSSLTRQDSEC